MPSTVIVILPVASSLTRTVIFSLSPIAILFVLTIIVEFALVFSLALTGTDAEAPGFSTLKLEVFVPGR